jgi:hypothetical protein
LIVTNMGMRTVHEDVCVGIFNSYGTLIVINRQDIGRLRDIRLVDWVPYYLGQ